MLPPHRWHREMVRTRSAVVKVAVAHLQLRVRRSTPRRGAAAGRGLAAGRRGATAAPTTPLRSNPSGGPSKLRQSLRTPRKPRCQRGISVAPVTTSPPSPPPPTPTPTRTRGGGTLSRSLVLDTLDGRTFKHKGDDAMRQLERRLMAEGAGHIAGVDEAGRGPLVRVHVARSCSLCRGHLAGATV